MRFLILFLCILGCARSAHIDQAFPIASLGIEWKPGPELPLGGARVVDSSLVGSTLYVDYDDGRRFARSFDGERVEQVGGGLNFTYVIEHDGTLYKFGEYQGDIYVETSLDGVSWVSQGRVLTHDPDPNSTWHQLWNVGVDVGPDGTWYMFIECGDSTPNQGSVGLCFAQGAGPRGFTRSVATEVLPHGGQPWVRYMPDGNLLVIHGMVNVPYGPFGNEWWITASTCTTAGVCTTHQDKWALGTPGVHDADPHLGETPEGLLLIFSVDQSHLQSVVLNKSVAELYEALTRP